MYNFIVKMHLKWCIINTLFLIFCHHCNSGESSVRAPSKSCLDSKMYCSDCYTSVICNGIETMDITCEAGTEACELVGNYSNCVAQSLVPECQCLSHPSRMADKYDPNKFIICLSDGPHVETCKPDMIYNEDTESCVDASTITTTTALTPPQTNCIPESPLFSLLDCTHGQLCLTDGSSRLLECKQGYIVNETKKDCIHFEPFSCPLGQPTGLYQDSLNCSVFHLCSNSVEQGNPKFCPNGYLFDQRTESCVNPDSTTGVQCPNGCLPNYPPEVICVDNIERFGIDCKNYYQCTDFPDGSLHAVSYECYGEFVYNDQMEYCDLPANVPECS